MSGGRFLSRFACVAATFILLGGCAKSSTANCIGVIYVSVAADGSISVDGKTVAVPSLDEKLSVLKPSAKVVFYYRENAQTEPTPSQASEIGQVLNAIMRLQLPISLSSKSDFSDVIDGAGNSQPRNSCPDFR